MMPAPRRSTPHDVMRASPFSTSNCALPAGRARQSVRSAACLAVGGKVDGARVRPDAYAEPPRRRPGDGTDDQRVEFLAWLRGHVERRPGAVAEQGIARKAYRRARFGRNRPENALQGPAGRGGDGQSAGAKALIGSAGWQHPAPAIADARLPIVSPRAGDGVSGGVAIADLQDVQRAIFGRIGELGGKAGECLRLAKCRARRCTAAGCRQQADQRRADQVPGPVRACRCRFGSAAGIGNQARRSEPPAAP